MMNLIVNCDDFGLSSEINEGILAAHQIGVLKSCTALVTGRAFDNAVELAKNNPGLSVGLHINLDEHLGFGPGKYQGRNLFNIDMLYHSNALLQMNAIEYEIETQINKFLETGLAMSHLDGHHHAHLFPGVFEVVTNLVQKYDLPRKLRFYKQFYQGSPGLYTRFRGILKERGIKYVDYFFDFSSTDIENLPQGKGRAELMVHISLPNGDLWRQRQFEKLVDAKFVKSIYSKDHVVSSYRDL